MFKEFKEFALKGNLLDLSIAFVMGAAFTKLSTSFIDDLIMPFVARLSSGVDFSNSYLSLSAKVPYGLSLIDAKKLGPVVAWGNFISVGINFFIVAFVMFLLVKAMNRLKLSAAKEPAPTPAQEVLLTEIRDLLKQSQNKN
ncbi:MAG: large conductance mechanosensitive channel protein MscL [Verrucomicrobia bacterium]|nr:MAG: large conductance mechanosensitive channel protein MscL [Verrucomicrobiota bacterium]